MGLPETSDGPRLAPAAVAAAYVRRIFDRTCGPSTIRWWASQGLIGQHGKDGRAVLYALEEVHRVADREQPGAAT